MTEIKVVQGDLLAQEGLDFIVNAANSHLAHGGGIAAAIDRAARGSKEVFVGTQLNAGGQMWVHENFDHPLIPTGGAGFTSAGNLPFNAVIHAVGPVYGGGSYKEADLLFLAHMSAMVVAGNLTKEREVLGRVGFPALSCGIFGYPVDLAAPIAVRAAMQFIEFCGLAEVRFVLFSDDHLEAYAAALAFEEARADVAVVREQIVGADRADVGRHRQGCREGLTMPQRRRSGSDNDPRIAFCRHGRHMDDACPECPRDRAQAQPKPQTWKEKMAADTARVQNNPRYLGNL